MVVADSNHSNHMYNDTRQLGYYRTPSISIPVLAFHSCKHLGNQVRITPPVPGYSTPLIGNSGSGRGCTVHVKVCRQRTAYDVHRMVLLSLSEHKIVEGINFGERYRLVQVLSLLTNAHYLFIHLLFKLLSGVGIFFHCYSSCHLQLSCSCVDF